MDIVQCIPCLWVLGYTTIHDDKVCNNKPQGVLVSIISTEIIVKVGIWTVSKAGDEQRRLQYLGPMLQSEDDFKTGF